MPVVDANLLVVLVSGDPRRTLVLLVRQHHTKWTRFYLAEPDVETSWTNFQAELKKVGLMKIKRTSVRELSQRDVFLMDSIW